MSLSFSCSLCRICRALRDEGARARYNIRQLLAEKESSLWGLNQKAYSGEHCLRTDLPEVVEVLAAHTRRFVAAHETGRHDNALLKVTLLARSSSHCQTFCN